VFRPGEATAKQIQNKDLAQEYLNPYVYVGNNVANLIDPDGLVSFAQLNGCDTCESSTVARGFDFDSMPQPSYPSPVTEAWLLGAGESGGMSSGSFGSIDMGFGRRGLPNAVLSGMGAGEKQAAAGKLSVIAGAVGSMVQKVPDPVYDVASIGLSLGAFAFEASNPIGWGIVGASAMVSAANTYKIYKQGGTTSKILINAGSTVASPFLSPMVGFNATKINLIYNYLSQ